MVVNMELNLAIHPAVAAAALMLLRFLLAAAMARARVRVTSLHAAPGARRQASSACNENGKVRNFL
jgi:hypothetical protein